MMFATFPLSLVLSVVVALVIPLVVGLVTTRVTSSATKGILLTALSVVTGVLTEAANALASGEPYDWGVGVLNALLALGVAQTSYSALWKPTGATTALQEVGTPTPEELEDYDGRAVVPDDLVPEGTLKITEDAVTDSDAFVTHAKPRHVAEDSQPGELGRNTLDD